MSDDSLQQAIAAIRAGDKNTGKVLLAHVLRTDPHNGSAWEWLACTVDDAGQKRECLERALKINPNSQWARQQLDALTPRQVVYAQPAKSRSSKGVGKYIVGTVAVIVVLVLVVGLVLCYDLAKVGELAERQQVESPTGKWWTHTSTSALDDSTTVAIGLEAENEVQGWITRSKPTLVVRCIAGETEVFVNAGMVLEMGPNTWGVVPTRIRFDSGTAQDLGARESTDRTGFFYGYAVSLAKQMMQHDTMVIGFTPLNTGEVAATFDLRGLSEAIKPVREACGW
jgi:type VI secretion system protein VasI